MEFPGSDEKNLEVTVAEVSPETVRVDKIPDNGSSKVIEPTYAKKVRQMKLDWLNGKSSEGNSFHFIKVHILFYYLLYILTQKLWGSRLRLRLRRAGNWKVSP